VFLTILGLSFSQKATCLYFRPIRVSLQLLLSLLLRKQSCTFTQSFSHIFSERLMSAFHFLSMIALISAAQGDRLAIRFSTRDEIKSTEMNSIALNRAIFSRLSFSVRRFHYSFFHIIFSLATYLEVEIHFLSFSLFHISLIICTTERHCTFSEAQERQHQNVTEPCSADR